jgi:curved DNA-binding protein
MDHYNTLGVPRAATQEDIKKAYRKLVMQHHPDRTGGGTATTFNQIQEAYEILSNPNKRNEYDNPRPSFNGFMGQGFPGDVHAHNFDINSAFEQMFGHRRQTQQQQVYRTRVTTSLVDAYHCNEQLFNLSTPSGTKVITIKIPYGAQTGSQIRYDNVIDNAMLIVEFIILPDLRFERKGDDLYSNIPISVLDLIAGTMLEFKTINDKLVQVVVPEKTQPYMQLKIQGYGFPRTNGNGYGDQILLIKPFIPDSIDNNLMSTIRENQQINNSV